MIGLEKWLFFLGVFLGVIVWRLAAIIFRKSLAQKEPTDDE